jgi:predicted nucleotidyltransferase component of viral defense system
MNEQALKDRIKTIAKAEGREFGEVWRSLVLERFLARISGSDYRDQFIFKGGLLLSHYIEIGRETKDVDFLANLINADIPNVEKAFTEICSVGIDDGFSFEFFDLNPLDQPHMNYPGYRLNLNLKFGEKMKDKIQVDVGVGDLVDPKLESMELYQYRGKPIFEGEITLQIYPVETIFAEKLETVVSKGAANSRMKDFHDLVLLCRENGLLDVSKIQESIDRTFKNRKTKKELPVIFEGDDYKLMQPLWVAHLRGLGQVATNLSMPDALESVVAEINDWININKIS